MSFPRYYRHFIVLAFILNFAGLYAWPRLQAPGSPAPLLLLLRPVIPLQKLLQLAQKNEAYVRVQIYKEKAKEIQKLCSLPREKHSVEKKALLFKIHSYARSLELTRIRFDQKIRAWISKKLPRHRQKHLHTLQEAVLSLQEKRHQQIQNYLSHIPEKLDCQKNPREAIPTPPYLYYKPLYLARYEFWKRLSIEERLLLQKELGP